MGLLQRITGVSEQRFARQVVNAIRVAGIGDVWYDEDQFAVGYRRADSTRPGVLYLRNVYAECSGASAAYRRRRLAQLLDMTFNRPDWPKNFHEVAPRLRPVLRAATFGLGSAVGPEATPRVSRPALPYLREMVVMDTPTMMAYVGEHNLDTWGVDADELFDTARGNLAARAELTGSPVIRDRLRLYVDDGDAYYTSRLLLDGWLAGLSDVVGGRPVAFIPDVNTLMLTVDDPLVLPRLLCVVENGYRKVPRSLSPLAYTVDGYGAVVPYPAYPGHPAEGALHRAATVLACTEYEHQAGWLAERVGPDMYVAKLSPVQRPDGSMFSFATWTDIPTMLPRADIVAIGAMEDQPIWVRWADIMEVTDLAPMPGLYPERFQVDGWLDPAVMARLRERTTMP